MKVMKWVGKIVNVLLIAALAITAILVFTNLTSEGEPQVFGQELKVVYSGSMEPEIKTGAVIGIDKNFNVNNLKQGDVIMFQKEEGMFVTHRIIEVLNNNGQLMFRTQGDNNANPDANAVVPANIYGEMTSLNIPYLGYAMDFANSQFGLVLLLMLPGVWLLISSARSFYTAFKEKNQEKNNESTPTENVS